MIITKKINIIIDYPQYPIIHEIKIKTFFNDIYIFIKIIYLNNR